MAGRERLRETDYACRPLAAHHGPRFRVREGFVWDGRQRRSLEFPLRPQRRLEDAEEICAFLNRLNHGLGPAGVVAYLRLLEGEPEPIKYIRKQGASV